MKIYTSYFGNIPKIPHNITLVSIAGKTPDFFISAKYPTHTTYRKLAPKWVWWKEWKDKFGENPDSAESIAWYSEKYFETVLKPLDFKEVVDELKLISFGQDVCLMCYENPEKFCHRKLVSEWFVNNGIACEELPNKLVNS